MKATIEDIKQLIKEANIMAGDIENISPDVPLVSQGIDSLDMANIYLLTEEKYDIMIADENIINLKTVNDILNFINAAS